MVFRTNKHFKNHLDFFFLQVILAQFRKIIKYNYDFKITIIKSNLEKLKN